MSVSELRYTRAKNYAQQQRTVVMSVCIRFCRTILGCSAYRTESIVSGARFLQARSNPCAPLAHVVLLQHPPYLPRVFYGAPSPDPNDFFVHGISPRHHHLGPSLPPRPLFYTCTGTLRLPPPNGRFNEAPLASCSRRSLMMWTKMVPDPLRSFSPRSWPFRARRYGR